MGWVCDMTGGGEGGAAGECAMVTLEVGLAMQIVVWRG